VGIGNSVKVPVVVIRPIWFTVTLVNQSAASGPAAISFGEKCSCEQKWK
jgi:hypothetical protein